MDSATADELAAGAPGVITLGGKEYLCAAVSDQHFIAMRNYVRSKARRSKESMLDVLANLPPEQAKKLAALPPVVRADALRAIFPQGDAEEISQQAASDVVLSPDGCRFTAWLFLKGLNPELKRETLDMLITEENYLEVYTALDQATGLTRLIQQKQGDQGNRSGPPSF